MSHIITKLSNCSGLNRYWILQLCQEAIAEIRSLQSERDSYRHALMQVQYVVRSEYVECPVCYRTDMHTGANIDHKPACAFQAARITIYNGEQP